MKFGRHISSGLNMGSTCQHDAVISVGLFRLFAFLPGPTDGVLSVNRTSWE